MNWRLYIESRPDVMLGKPVFKGTRLTVQHVLERLGQGATEQDLLAAHPTLRPEHFRAAQAYAADSLASDETVLLDAGAT
ncbi:MAG: DUF433 domain-containing protein [Tepidisphaeraceae bacterium]